MTRNAPRIMVECDDCGNEHYFEIDQNELNAHMEMLGWRLDAGRDICPHCATRSISAEEAVILVEAPDEGQVEFQYMGPGTLLEITGRGKVLSLATAPKMPPWGALLIYKMRVFEVMEVELQGKFNRGDSIGCIVKQLLGEPIDA